MRFIFAILKLRPLGGKERDFIGLVEQFLARGHAVRVMTSEPLSASLDPRAEVTVLPVSAWTNHGRHRAFADAVKHACAGENGVVIAFERLPFADYLFVSSRPHGTAAGWQRDLPRHRALVALEQATFGPRATAFAFFLTEEQAAQYQRRYGIGPNRYAVLPTTFGTGRALPETYYASRRDVRAVLSIPQTTPLLVHVAVNGRLKGLDRAIDLLPQLPQAHLLVVGDASARFHRQARQRGVPSRVHFAGYADDVPRLLGATDLMVHPAREENTGTVILESLLYGVPAVASAECGYAEHLLRADAGTVVPAPFNQDTLLAQVRDALAPERLKRLKAAARRFGPQLAAEGGIEKVAGAMLTIIADRDGQA